MRPLLTAACLSALLLQNTRTVGTDTRVLYTECTLAALSQWAALEQLQSDAAADLWSEHAPAHVPSRVSLTIRDIAAFRAGITNARIMCRAPVDIAASLLDDGGRTDAPSGGLSLAVDGGTTDRRHVNTPNFFKDYRSTAEIHAALRAIASAHASGEHGVAAETLSIGQSRAGTDLLVLRLSAAGGRAKRSVFVNCLQHAREWVAAAACTFVAASLALGDRNTSGVALRTLRSADVYILPVANPDGYALTRSSNRLWRKSVTGGDAGVDMNRNWPVDAWGTVGTSRHHMSEVYAGPSAASEPEVAAIAAFIRHGLRDRPLAAGMDVHSYGQLVLRPPGITPGPLPNAAEEHVVSTLTNNVAQAMTRRRGVNYRPMRASALYPASGSMEDWLWERMRVPALTIELRDTGRHGFVLPAAEIADTGAELLAGVVAMIDLTH